VSLPSLQQTCKDWLVNLKYKTMKKLLIVDDNASIREILGMSLRDDNRFSIIEATSGEEAVEIALREMPKLILMDIMMPGKLNGIEATRVIKSDPSAKDIKIVILSAMGQQSDIEAGLKSGADDYFIKPFSPYELVNKIDEVLGL
jgi:two-component system phosphate regulon response regulator PhoB